MNKKTILTLRTGALILVVMLVLVAASGLAQALLPGSFNFQALASGEWNPRTAPKIAGTALAELPEAGCSLAANVRSCELWALPGSLSLPDSTTVPAWGFAGSAGGPAGTPGPIIRVHLGETLEVLLHNEVPGEAISLAFPGQEGLSTDMTGAASGGTTTYTFTPSRPGTFLYEAGLTSGGARQVAMGLYGVLIVEDPTAASEWDSEIVWVFSEVDPAFNANPGGFDMVDFKPRYWLINGQAFPDTGWVSVVAGHTVLMRYLNAGVEYHSIGLLGLDQEVLATDGAPLPFSYGMVAETLSPGQTMDVLVRVPAGAAGDTLYPIYDASLAQHNNSQLASDGHTTAFGGMLAFLRVTGEPPASQAGPVASNVLVTPAKTDGGTGAVLSATLTDDDVDVAGYEYFVDALGAPGTGAFIPATNPAPSITAEVTFPPEELALWSHGEHPLYIRGQDSSGNWGSPGSAVLYLDKLGPEVYALNLAPALTNTPVDIALTGTVDDRNTGDSLVTAAQYRFQGGAWVDAVLDQTGATMTGLTATIPAAEVPAADGAYTVEVQGQDEWGHWSETPASASLLVDMTAPDVTTVALDPALININAATIPANVRVTASLEDPLFNGVQSGLAGAEAFIDALGAPGGGFALLPVDGQFDQAAEQAYADIPSTEFTALALGEHQVLVLGLDAAGNWSTVAGTATITLEASTDTTGPAITGLAASPNPTAGATLVDLAATATDVDLASNIAAAEWFFGTDPATATAIYPMYAQDGAFSSPTEAIFAQIDVKALKLKNNTTYQVSVRAMDSAGNWGPVSTIDLQVTNR